MCGTGSTTDRLYSFILEENVGCWDKALNLSVELSGDKRVSEIWKTLPAPLDKEKEAEHGRTSYAEMGFYRWFVLN